jgi:putative transposase
VPKKKRTAVPRGPSSAAQAPNDRWSRDFVSDRLADGRAFRVLTLVENVGRVRPALAAHSVWSGQQVTEFLDQAIQRYGCPQTLQVDNGPELAGQALDAWAYRRGVQLCFSRPGKPMDNAYCESLTGSCGRSA